MEVYIGQHQVSGIQATLEEWKQCKPCQVLLVHSLQRSPADGTQWVNISKIHISSFRIMNYDRLIFVETLYLCIMLFTDIVIMVNFKGY
jgi:hypothetical protein